MDAGVAIATKDPTLREQMLRWCGAAGVGAYECHGVDDLRRVWRTAEQVMVGADLVGELADEQWSRRDHVHLVAHDPEAHWRSAVDLGASGVLSADAQSAAIDALAAALDGRVEGCSLAVVGGSGGVGASTFALALCHAAVRRELSAVVVDADPWGAGVELINGSEAVDGLRWSSLVAGGGRVSPNSLADALPVQHGVAAVSWGIDDTAELPEAAVEVWNAAVRAFDLVVVDQARAATDGRWDATVLGRSVLTLLVVGDDLAGLAAAHRQVAVLRDRCGSLAAVVAARPRGLGRTAVEETLGVPVICRIRPDSRVKLAVEHGRGPRRSRRLLRPASEVLDLVGLSGGSRED